MQVFLKRCYFQSCRDHFVAHNEASNNGLNFNDASFRLGVRIMTSLISAVSNPSFLDA